MSQIGDLKKIIARIQPKDTELTTENMQRIIFSQYRTQRNRYELTRDMRRIIDTHIAETTEYASLDDALIHDISRGRLALALNTLYQRMETQVFPNVIYRK